MKQTPFETFRATLEASARYSKRDDQRFKCVNTNAWVVGDELFLNIKFYDGVRLQ